MSRPTTPTPRPNATPAASPAWRRLPSSNGFALVSVVTLACTLLSAPAATAEADSLAPSCATECVTPYGSSLGHTPGGVTAFSNCSSECVSRQPHETAGTYLGMKWQCVEFARRWLFEQRGLVFGDVDVAADLWNDIDYLTRVRDRARLPVQNIVNGAASPPRVGDLLIYDRAFRNTGHVAVVVRADDGRGSVQVAEQNYDNGPWLADHARSIPVVAHEKRYWLLDAYLLGWKRLVKSDIDPSPANEAAMPSPLPRIRPSGTR